MKDFFGRLRRGVNGAMVRGEERGEELVEYSLIVAVIAILLIAVIALVSRNALGT
jgi:Flp pilus assembly pilin Flp